MDRWDLFTETAEAGEVAKLCTQLIVLEAAAKQSFSREREAHWTQGPYLHCSVLSPCSRSSRTEHPQFTPLTRRHDVQASLLSSLSLLSVSQRMAALKTISLESIAWREGCGEWEQGYDRIPSSPDFPQKTKAMSRDFSREAGNLAWVTKWREKVTSHTLAWPGGGYAGHLLARGKAKGNLRWDLI